MPRVDFGTIPPPPHYRVIATAKFVRIELFDEIVLSLPRRHFASELHRQWANILDPVAADAFCYGALAMFREMREGA